MFKFKTLLNKKTFCTINNEIILSKKLGKEGNILGLFLNSQKNRNALSKNLLEELKRNINLINSDHSIRAVILMSNFPAIFCAGADLKERQSMTEIDTENFVTDLRKTFQSFDEIRVPSICAIDGFALGGGLELALSSDMRICTKNSTLGLTECSLGIIPGAGGTQRLSRLIGISRAKELIFTSEKINAEKALSIGLVNHIVESYNDLEIKAVEIGEKIVLNAPLSIVNAKTAISKGYSFDIKTGLDVESMCYRNILGTVDRTEGLKAFLEKRKPKYLGK